jgi:hypothetical protein
LSTAFDRGPERHGHAESRRLVRRISVAETLLVALFLAGVATAVFAAHVRRGSFYSDDWANAAYYRLADPPGYWSSVGHLQKELGGRPLSALLLPIPYAVFGLHAAPHLALAVALGVATSLCFYVLLRTLSLAPLHAGAVATLALLFPWADSVRLWPTASINTLSVCFFLIGLTVAIRALDSHGTAALARHGTAVALYVASVLTYEATGGAAMLAGALYLRARDRAGALRRWAADVFAVGGALVYSLTTTVAARHVGSLAERVHDLRTFGRESVLLFASALVPVGRTDALEKGLGVTAVAAALGIVAVRRVLRSDDRELRFWLWVVGAAIVAIGAAEFMFLGSLLHPLSPGKDNRANIFAALGYCLLTYAVVSGATHLVARRTAAVALATIVVAAIAIAYGFRANADASAWTHATRLQRDVVRAITATGVRLSHSDAVFTFGAPADVKAGVPVFDRSWDLAGALRLRTGDRALRAFPVFQGVVVRCVRRGVRVAGPGSYGAEFARYGPAVFVDVPVRKATRPQTERQCHKARVHYLARGVVPPRGPASP